MKIKTAGCLLSASAKGKACIGEEENRRSLFFFLSLRARSRALASLARSPVNEKKNKTTSVYRLCSTLRFSFDVSVAEQCSDLFGICNLF